MSARPTHAQKRLLIRVAAVETFYIINGHEYRSAASLDEQGLVAFVPKSCTCEITEAGRVEAAALMGLS